jgi:hypothetical protein
MLCPNIGHCRLEMSDLLHFGDETTRDRRLIAVGRVDR